MKRKFKWFFILILIPLYFTSITHANGYYYTYVGEVYYIEKKNDYPPDSVQVEMPEGSGVKNFSCDYVSGSGLNAINEWYFNDKNHFAEYHYGLNVTHQETGQHTEDLYERSRMMRLASILIFFGSKN
jgi:arylsulfatase A-like enzyme